MNYERIYENIIKNAKDRQSYPTPYEKHHIIPKSCGGSNRKENIVNLSLREHYICHLLLVKMYRNTEYYAKMQRAAFFMTRGMKVKSRIYESIKRSHIENLKQQKISEDHKKAISVANKNNKGRTGYKNTPEHNEALRKANLGRKLSEETKHIWSTQRKGKEPWNKGKTGLKYNYSKTRRYKSRSPHTQETIEKMRHARIEYHKRKKSTNGK